MSSTQTVRRPSGGAAVHTVPAIELMGLTKSFGTVHAVRGIDLTVAPGEVVALLGPNGAGKTTTIDLLLGLARPDAGEVRVHGLDPTTAVRHGLISAVMQTGGLLKDLTVKETLQLTASLFAGTRPVDEVLTRAGISDIGDRRVGKCSGGQQQRLRFAMALLPDPELLILDEPTTGMDVTGRRDFWNAIHEDAARGRTVVFATHYLEEADAYADRIVLVSHGKVVADGTASEVKSLVSGRTIRATLSDADPVVVQQLRDMDTAESVELRGDTLLVTSTDSDAVARHLLTTTDARDLEITTRGLEDAFISLTSDGAES
ncbi:multidrug ABC transporter ATP-binding protein [Phycicoccus sp. Root563]|uniref:ABC transporter ATP-binding protein n=1 Tax=Phycicoccus sp. Root563 TaxID=1736562 RepID=UPI000703662D|nr:ABC transporter ATP-binding protein [Phycicoccus sp. Root563]KQZ87501.1 multidrug ABC transporter ATP-binding protein [Phycicoccus sp. Root563]